MNFLVYRAKKIGRDDYAEGYLLESSVIISKKNIAKDGFLPIIVEEIDIIDPSTLAIHFPDMIDSEGNKIFASLSEDGKGGDILHFYTYSSREKGMTRVCMYDNCRIIPQQDDDFIQDEQGDWFEGNGFKIVGIQE